MSKNKKNTNPALTSRAPSGGVSFPTKTKKSKWKRKVYAPATFADEKCVEYWAKGKNGLLLMIFIVQLDNTKKIKHEIELTAYIDNGDEPVISKTFKSVDSLKEIEGMITEYQATLVSLTMEYLYDKIAEVAGFTPSDY